MNASPPHDEPQRLYAERYFYAGLLIIALLTFSIHRILVFRQEFLDVDFLMLFEKVGRGQLFPIYGRPVASAGFRTGSFEYYLQAVPFALGLGLRGALIWLSLIYTLGNVLLMLSLRKIISARVSLLAGLACANCFPPMLFTANFQNNSLVAPFALITYSLTLLFLKQSRFHLRRIAVFGLVIGLLPQVHWGSLVLLPGIAMLLIWRRIKFGTLGWAVFFSIVLLPWLPYLFQEATTGWPNVSAMWQAGLNDHLPTVADKRSISWLLLFLSPAGVWTLAILLLTGIVAFLRRWNIERETKTLLLFSLVQLLIPLLSYDFFKRGFLAIFIPALPLLAALTPDLAAETWAALRQRPDRLMKWRNQASTVVAVLILAFPAPFAYFLYTKITGCTPLTTGHLYYLARNACEFGLPVDGRSWEGYIKGPYLDLSSFGSDFLRRSLAPKHCPQTGDNNVLLVSQTDIKNTPIVGAKYYRGFYYIEQPHFVTFLEYRPDAQGNPVLSGKVRPEARYLTVQLSQNQLAESRLPSMSIQIDDRQLTDYCYHPPSRCTRNDIVRFTYHLPVSETSMSFQIKYNEGLNFGGRYSFYFHSVLLTDPCDTTAEY